MKGVCRAIKITDTVYWVGAIDWHMRDFHGYYTGRGSTYNAFLIHTQRPGATYVAPSYRWKKEYGRLIKPNSLPIVILQPMGPVMFVFDVSDTEPGPNAIKLPSKVTDPFSVIGGDADIELRKTKSNAVRDGIRIQYQKAGSPKGQALLKTSIEIDCLTWFMNTERMPKAG